MTNKRFSRTRALGAAVLPPPHPWAGWLGWCHQCETWQLADAARWLPMPWNRGEFDWACVDCWDEPWGLGVWPMVCPEHLASEHLELVVTQPDAYDVPWLVRCDECDHTE